MTLDDLAQLEAERLPPRERRFEGPRDPAARREWFANRIAMSSFADARRKSFKHTSPRY